MNGVMTPRAENARILIGIKLAHTAVWAMFAGCIGVLPFAALTRHFRLAGFLALAVLAECLVLVVNGRRCPLTDVAARYTEGRRANFDIYLPEWLARSNKVIFGTLFVVGLIVFGMAWRMR
ncbi:hypothetical protein [Occallatibacter riparius]|uniref:DUF2784 domain-containing protein n=1 Tax=Occallatibacter riparius TaxID=1002689 RepID=A0A9J7BVE8_9BACT|nr:hypothetical protein [Occallatibacter riparius]UWZ86513.1 hypothetical protein MOP44_11335 [Occallatibacter riparius]